MGARIVITGDRHEWAICEQVRNHMRHLALNAAGQTNLGMLIALIERLHLFISNDSGPSHIAQALNTPSITIFGAASFEDWAAGDTTLHRALSVPVSCRPCFLSECPIGYQCLHGITTGHVIHHAAEVLHKQALQISGRRNK